LNPLGGREACGFVDNAKRVAHKPHRPNNTKQRTFDVLQNADIFTRYEQGGVFPNLFRPRP
jgi:hypothetical protein